MNYGKLIYNKMSFEEKSKILGFVKFICVFWV